MIFVSSGQARRGIAEVAGGGGGGGGAAGEGRGGGGRETQSRGRGGRLRGPAAEVPGHVRSQGAEGLQTRPGDAGGRRSCHAVLLRRGGVGER